jgi:hypothetical protein
MRRFLLEIRNELDLIYVQVVNIRSDPDIFRIKNSKRIRIKTYDIIFIFQAPLALLNRLRDKVNQIVKKNVFLACAK